MPDAMSEKPLRLQRELDQNFSYVQEVKCRNRFYIREGYFYVFLSPVYLLNHSIHVHATFISTEE